MEDAGAAAIVLHSLFEERIDVEGAHLERYLTESGESHAEALAHFPNLVGYDLDPDGYLEHLRRAKEAEAIPVISLNGVSTGGWSDFAKKIEQAGADCARAQRLLRANGSAVDGSERGEHVHRPGA